MTTDKKNKDHTDSAGHESPVDLERLELIMDGDDDARDEFCHVYIRQSEDTIEDLRQALESGDDTQWKKAAHKLKGSSQTFGAGALSALCLEAEMGHEASIEAKKKWLAKIEDSFARVKECIVHITKN